MAVLRRGQTGRGWRTAAAAPQPRPRERSRRVARASLLCRECCARAALKLARRAMLGRLIRLDASGSGLRLDATLDEPASWRGPALSQSSGAKRGGSRRQLGSCGVCWTAASRERRDDECNRLRRVLFHCERPVPTTLRFGTRAAPALLLVRTVQHLSATSADAAAADARSVRGEQCRWTTRSPRTRPRSARRSAR